MSLLKMPINTLLTPIFQPLDRGEFEKNFGEERKEWEAMVCGF
jgi:hypothetical protein